MNLIQSFLAKLERQPTETTLKRVILMDDARRIMGIIEKHIEEVDAFSIVVVHGSKVETYISGMSELQAVGVLDIGKDQLKASISR